MIQNSEKRRINKYKKFIRSLDYYKYAMKNKPNIQKYFNDVISLYDRKIIKRQDQVEKILQKLVFDRGVGPKNAMKKIDKLNPLVPFHIGAIVTRKASYKQRNGRWSTAKEEPVKGKLNFKVLAHTMEEAKQIVLDEINDDLTQEDSYVVRNVEDVEFTSAINESQLVPMTTRHGFLRAVKYAKYNDIENCELYDKKEGFCTFDNFVGIYSQYFKVTKEKLINECKEFYQNKYFKQTNFASSSCANVSFSLLLVSTSCVF